MEPLWTDEQIKQAVRSKLEEVNDPRISEYGAPMMHPLPAIELCGRIRNDYQQRIAELEAEVEQLRAAQWTPVFPIASFDLPRGVGIMVDERYHINVFFGDSIPYQLQLPANLRLCKRGDA